MSTSNAALEAHAEVLRSEIAVVDDDVAVLLAIQQRYRGLIPTAAAAADSMAAGSRVRSGSAGRRPASGSSAKVASAPLLEGALVFLSEQRESKSRQLSAVMDQQSSIAAALDRAHALADEVRGRDFPAPYYPQASYLSHHHSQQQHFGQNNVSVSPPFITSLAHNNLSYSYAQREAGAYDAPRAPAAAPTPIGFEPPLAIGGWRSYLRENGQSPSRSPDRRGAHPAATQGQWWADAVDRSAGMAAGSRISFSEVQPSPLRPMLVVLPSGSKTNLATGITTTTA
jgi:hypothetical protein